MKVYCRDPKNPKGALAMFKVSEELTINEALKAVRDDMRVRVALAVIK